MNMWKVNNNDNDNIDNDNIDNTDKEQKFYPNNSLELSTQVS